MPPTVSLPVHTASRTGRLTLAVAVAIFLLAAVLRIDRTAGFNGVGFDEGLYRNYVIQLDHVGLVNFPAIAELHLEDQRKPDSVTKLPPTRFLYVFSGWLAKRLLFGDAPPLARGAPGFAWRDPALVALHWVSALFSILMVGLVGLAAYRMCGAPVMLGTMLLVATSPVQIHFAQHALIDGFFAFWATFCLWLLWEVLRQPQRRGWLFAYSLSIAAMVMAKENSFFVFVALCGLIVVSPRLGFANSRLMLLGASIAGATLGTALLLMLAGGLPPFLETYQLLVTKAQQNSYAIKTGDGPWHRYLVEMLLVQPLVFLLAIGALFTQLPKNRALLYLGLFSLLTYVFMCNVKYAMNLRYASVWELPLCALASTQLLQLSERFGNRRQLIATLLFVGIGAFGLSQYLKLFANTPLYELVTEGLLRALQILK